MGLILEGLALKGLAQDVSELELEGLAKGGLALRHWYVIPYRSSGVTDIGGAGTGGLAIGGLVLEQIYL